MSTAQAKKPITKSQIRERAFLAKYIDPESPTHLNGVQSALAVNPDQSYGTASGYASQTLQKPHIQNTINEMLERLEAGYEVRTQALVDIALNREQQTVVTEHYAKDKKTGKMKLVAKDVVEKPVSTRDRIAALAKISKDSGEDTIAHTRNRMISATMRKMGDRMLREAMKAPHGLPEDMLSDARDVSPADAIDEEIDSCLDASECADEPIQGSEDGCVHDEKDSQPVEPGLGGKTGEAPDIPSPPSPQSKNNMGAPPDA